MNNLDWGRIFSIVFIFLAMNISSATAWDDFGRLEQQQQMFQWELERQHQQQQWQQTVEQQRLDDLEHRQRMWQLQEEQRQQQRRIREGFRRAR